MLFSNGVDSRWSRFELRRVVLLSLSEDALPCLSDSIYQGRQPYLLPPDLHMEVVVNSHEFMEAGIRELAGHSFSL